MVAVTRSMPTGLRFAAEPDIMPIYEAEALARALAAFTPTDEAESLLAKTAEEPGPDKISPTRSASTICASGTLG